MQQPPPPQLMISIFIHIQSNGFVDGTEDLGDSAAEGPLVKDHIFVHPQDECLKSNVT